MTRSPTDVTELAAGREMDARVAEKVMGWRLDTSWTVPKYGALGYNRDHGEPIPMWRQADGTCAPHPFDRRFRPSTDIAAAWQVVERLLARGDWPCIEPPDGEDSPRWCVHVELATGTACRGYGDTAPEAICRAAVAAVETQP